MSASEASRVGAEVLDLALQRRLDPQWMRERMADPSSRILAVRGTEVLVEEGASGRLGWLPGAAGAHRDADTEPVLLGLLGGRALFAIDVSSLEDPARKLGLGPSHRFRRLDAAVLRLTDAEGSIAGRARALVSWHAGHRFCSACGGATRSSSGGNARECRECGREHLPHVDPVAVVLAVRPGRCLLARQEDWPPGVFSALTAFVEPGESLAQAARREVRDRTGLATKTVRCRHSQPWADPLSLMLGCIVGVSCDGDVRPDEEALVEARWFARDEVLRALRNEPGAAPSLLLPPPLSAAHALIRIWAQAGSAEEDGTEEDSASL